jgi:hypothetical protein
MKIHILGFKVSVMLRGILICSTSVAATTSEELHLNNLLLKLEYACRGVNFSDTEASKLSNVKQYFAELQTFGITINCREIKAKKVEEEEQRRLDEIEDTKRRHQEEIENYKKEVALNQERKRLEEERQKQEEQRKLQEAAIAERAYIEDLARKTREAPQTLREMSKDKFCLTYGKYLRGEETDDFGKAENMMALIKKEASRRRLSINNSLVKSENIRLGMSECELFASWGYPKDSNRTVGYFGEHIQYIYSNAYVYTENGRVTSWQD